VGPALLLGLLVASAQAAPPSWARHDTERLEGNLYRAVCSGIGPSIGFARQDAIDSCKVSAAQHLSSDVSVRSLSVTSEIQGAYQQEVTNHATVSGLVCIPRREEIQETDSQVRLWVLCEFDLSQARPEPETISPSRPLYAVDARRVLTVATVPRCGDLIVRGGGPGRIVRCDRNPVSLFLQPTDQEVVVRAEGYFPKALRVDPGGEARRYEKVVLDPAP
jgi:hypothetical protein